MALLIKIIYQFFYNYRVCLSHSLEYIRESVKVASVWVTGTTYVSQLRHKSIHTLGNTHTQTDTQTPSACCPPTRSTRCQSEAEQLLPLQRFASLRYPKPKATRHASRLSFLLPLPPSLHTPLSSTSCLFMPQSPLLATRTLGAL